MITQNYLMGLKAIVQMVEPDCPPNWNTGYLTLEWNVKSIFFFQVV